PVESAWQLAWVDPASAGHSGSPSFAGPNINRHDTFIYHFRVKLTTHWRCLILVSQGWLQPGTVFEMPARRSALRQAETLPTHSRAKCPLNQQRVAARTSSPQGAEKCGPLRDTPVTLALGRGRGRVLLEKDY
ncbi:MAG: hypothetical protein ACRD10_00145, partial [Terriglobia bacterium]